MKRILRPSRWPVRWRLAAASAGLTLAILLVFAAVVGYLAGERVRDDFDRDVQREAASIAARTQILSNGLEYVYRGPVLNSVAAANGASIRVFLTDGTLLIESKNAIDFGPPGVQTTPESPVKLTTVAIINEGQTRGYLQYARSKEQVDSTIARIWLFIAAGVLGGTLLASLAGLAIADRAMRPIAGLTSTAREIAATRDPSRRLPEPQAADEVGELTETLQEMLEALTAAQAEREIAMRRQREFVADASHELRTPLTSVLANLELLQESLKEAGSEGEDPLMVASALRSSRRMSRLVADLLILARADAGRHSPRSRCDIAEIAREAAAEVTPMLAGRQLKVAEMPVAYVIGARDELHRLMVNLLSNAIHHTPSETHIEVSARIEGAEVVVEVADDGPGIPEQMREQVFDRFTRVGGSADTSASDGTGLGLSIVRSVAESHGGSVSAQESHLGGASFRVRLPLAAREAGIPAKV
jgi:two-component system OmpR family sensor kinase